MSTIAIPVNDLARYAGQVSDSLAAQAAQVLRSGHYVLGPGVRAFEAEFAAYCGVPHCIAVGNGTDALELALRALGVVPGDAVMVAANAAMYGTTAVLAIGATPVFADVDPSTGLFTGPLLEAALARGDKPKAVIVTHLYGRLAPMAEILAACRAHGVAVLEDCAQAHGARDANGTKAGAHGDIATFSFYPTKNLGAIGDGGAIACRDDALAGRCRQLRQYGWSSKYTNELAGGRNTRLDEIQAAFLRVLLGDLDRRNARRLAIANRYSAQIRHRDIAVPAVAGDEFVAHLYVVQAGARESLAKHLAANGVGTDIHYPTPDHRQPVHGGRFAQVSLPNTERLCTRVLTLPCFPEMTDAEVDAVIAACNAWPG
jgi:dTDP-4-amino-4,6-dideoxygalactose transaminase